MRISGEGANWVKFWVAYLVLTRNMIQTIHCVLVCILLNVLSSFYRAHHDLSPVQVYIGTQSIDNVIKYDFF